jgi:hypothetical protein
VIARPLPAPAHRAAPRHGVRSARSASAARRARNSRLRYRAIGRIVVCLGLLTTLVLLYLALVANVTRTRYELGRAERERHALVEQTARNDDEIAQLESRDRLERIAASLGMREPLAFAVVTLPRERRHQRVAPHGVAALLPMMQSIMGIAQK